MKSWEHIAAVMNSAPYDDLLASGWEPFAVLYHSLHGGGEALHVHFRRPVVEESADELWIEWLTRALSAWVDGIKDDMPVLTGVEKPKDES